ncbi:MAG: hypothetical protein IT324_33630, partial [Anaerolineae bacterium]|nr:hypothetical protein [Anaerolineae bacterium]
LTMGGQGRVLPGTPNNLNSKPSRPSLDSTSQKLASIPGGGMFTVLEGPVCNQGITWWKVNYNGTEGWTGESDTKYWVEPTSK